MSGSDISWNIICKSAPCCRQITTPAPHQSVTGRIPFLPPNQQRQSTEGKTLLSIRFVNFQEEQEEPIYMNVNQPKKKPAKGVRDEILREKRGKRSHRSQSQDEEPVYANQAQVLAELQRQQQEQRAVLEEQERLERERLEREAERQRIDEAEAKRLRQVGQSIKFD